MVQIPGVTWSWKEPWKGLGPVFIEERDFMDV